MWDPRQKNDPVAVMEPAEGDDRRDCWAVAFGKYLFTINLSLTLSHWRGGNSTLSKMPAPKYLLAGDPVVVYLVVPNLGFVLDSVP